MFRSLFAWREDRKLRREAEPVEYRPYKAYVEKQTLPIVVYTTGQRIEGFMHVTYHHRALDVLNSPDPFLPVTAARIYDATTSVLLGERNFIAINKTHLVLLWEAGKPVSTSGEPETEGGGQFEASQENVPETGAAPGTPQERAEK